MNTTVKICRKQGYVTNIFGRRINLRESMIKTLASEVFKKELQLMLQFKDLLLI
jgi:DNA polymerase I-like protein with 3'-5' exonuclease and polymerase domains